MFIGHCVYNPIKRIQRFLDLAADVANFMDYIDNLTSQNATELISVLDISVTGK